MFRAKSELSAALAEQVLDGIEEGLLIFDRHDRVRFSNSAFEALWNISGSEILGAESSEVARRLCRRALNPASIAELESRLADPAAPSTVELVLEDDRYVRLTSQPLTGRVTAHGRVWRFRNQTEEKRSELAMLHSQKLESLGVLAGGMAHDFNNLLSSIMGHSELGLEEVDVDSPTADSLRSIGRAAERASELTQQLLAYAGEGTVLVEPVDLSALTLDILELLKVSLPEAVELELDLAEQPPPIIADATQMRQIVMNLILNAAEAVGAGDRISVSTGERRLDSSEIARSLHDTGTRPGDFVYITVRDTGPGMDEATLARIFDPFFSTKFTGRGLGLAAVLGIVRGHRGLIRVESEPGGGATFTVDLPRAHASESAPR